MTDGERLASIEKEIANIKPWLEKVDAKLDEIVPMVKENNSWVTGTKKAVITIAILLPAGGLVTTLFFVLRSFIK